MAVGCGKQLAIRLIFQQLLHVRCILIDEILQRNKQSLGCILDDIDVGQDSLSVEGIWKIAGKNKSLFLTPAILTAHIPFDMDIGFLLEVLEKFKVGEILVVP
ncbi:hypothetical protein SDC9_105667 [bioreactor metagenome]|uniref:Uncharacterized protein n=1 Tax=bioreactor metagenome TaxID=1076179 RepID=A0A645BAX2_9ZZZZ